MGQTKHIGIKLSVQGCYHSDHRQDTLEVTGGEMSAGGGEPGSLMEMSLEKFLRIDEIWKGGKGQGRLSGRASAVCVLRLGEAIVERPVRAKEATCLHQGVAVAPRTSWHVTAECRAPSARQPWVGLFPAVSAGRSGVTVRLREPCVGAQ